MPRTAEPRIVDFEPIEGGYPTVREVIKRTLILFLMRFEYHQRRKAREAFKKSYD